MGSNGKVENLILGIGDLSRRITKCLEALEEKLPENFDSMSEEEKLELYKKISETYRSKIGLLQRIKKDINKG